MSTKSKTPEQVMAQVNAGANATAKIREQLFTVIDHKLDTPSPIEMGIDPNTEVEELPSVAVYTSRGHYMGTVGKVYQSMQPIDFLRELEDSVLGSGLKLDLGKLQYDEYGNGKKISFRIPLQEVKFKNKAKLGESIRTYLQFSTGYGGHYQTKLGVYTDRLVCKNGMVVSNMDFGVKLRHTANNNAKVLALTDNVVKVASAAEEHGDWLKALDKITVTKEEIDTMRQKLMKSRQKEEYSKLHKQRQVIWDKINTSFEIEMQRTGQTAFGLLQGATYYTNHMVKNDPNEVPDYIQIGTGAELNRIAENYVATLL